MKAYALGIVLLVLVSMIWVSASHLIKEIFDREYDKPVFLTYFNTCGFSLWLMGGCCWEEWRAELPECLGGRPIPGEGFHGWRVYLRAACLFSPIWFTANYAFNLSLTVSSVASNSILSNTSSLWTMVLSSIVLNEEIGVVKIVAVLLTLSGVALVASAEHPGTQNEISGHVGDGLALFAACCHAGYTVMLRLKLPNTVKMPIFFGYVGAVTMAAGAPLLYCLHVFGYETLEIPSLHTFCLLSVNAIIGTNISDVLWAQAVLLTSPVVATLGLSLTIPFGMLSDVLVSSRSFSLPYLSGAVLVLLGFVLINTSGYLSELSQNLMASPRSETGTGYTDDIEASEEELQVLTT